MNLYDLHKDKSKLKGYDEVSKHDLEVAWDRYVDDVEELRKRENLWATDPDFALMYAEEVDNKFPLGDKVISALASDAHTALNYAKFVLRGPFPEGEESISKDADDAVEYARKVLKRRFESAEHVIARSSSAAVEYATRVLKGRFKEAERAIAQDPYLAVEYAKEILDGRFEEAEREISEYERADYEYRGNLSDGDRRAYVKKYHGYDPED